MCSPMTARPTPAVGTGQPDPSAAQRAALQYADTQKKLRESRGRRSMFLTYDSPAPLQQKGAERTVGRPGGSTPLLGG